MGRNRQNPGTPTPVVQAIKLTQMYGKKLIPQSQMCVKDNFIIFYKQYFFDGPLPNGKIS